MRQLNSNCHIPTKTNRYPILFTGKKDKRGLVALSDGSIVDEALLSPNLDQDNKEDEALFQQSLLNGLAGFVGNLPVQNLQKETVSTGQLLMENSWT